MIKVLSKSVTIMFIFDILAFIFSSLFSCKEVGISGRLLALTVVLLAVTGMIVLFLKSNYKIREFNITGRNMYLLFEGVFMAHVPTAIMLFALVDFNQAIKFLSLNIFIVFLALEIYRLFFHVYLFKFKSEKNILIIGTGDKAKQIADVIVSKKALRMKIIGFIKDVASSDDMLINDKDYKLFDQSVSLPQIIKENKVDIVIVATNSCIDESMFPSMIFGIPKSVKVYAMPEFYEMVTYKFFIDKETIDALFYQYKHNRSNVYEVCKRGFDIFAALMILIVMLPIMVYLVIRVRLTDGGPAIYTQNRVGKGGKTFKMYKLRTMYKNDYIPLEGNIKYTEGQDKDERVIPFCKFVRKARFDEVPQMVNVLRGEMSIVGPRAEWEDLVKIYEKQIPYYTCRQWVKTGCAGWAQINQGHCVLKDDVAEKLQYDLYYLKHRNLLWDIGILIKVIFLAVGGRHG